MTAILAWDFPLPRTHTGIPFGNGVQGVLVWGDQALHLTVSRAGFWDHRGGTPFRTRTTYARLRALLEAGDEAGVRAAFAKGGGRAHRPTQLGGGRLELAFAGWRPERASLATATAELTITFRADDGRCAALRLRQAIDAERTELDWDAALGQPAVRQATVWDHIAAHLAEQGIAAPERWQDDAGGGFLQRLPEDDPLAVAWSLGAGTLVVATALGPEAGQEVRRTLALDAQALRARTLAWWAGYWAAVPRIRLPDPLLQRVTDLGLWKQAGLTTPGGVAAALQGPWMEEYQPLPWSNDYHFNINVQMVYGPCLPTNRAEHLEPLWDMLRAWLPELKRNAQAFFGAEDALMLPHAVDDRCQVIGTYWTGTIDHGCTAWMALLAFRHWRHTGEARMLELAWELLAGAFGGYWAMREEVDGRLSLPVTVSPEYGGDGMQAWGRDASFQLAAAHAVAEALPIAARALGRPDDPRWADLSARLPAYASTGGEQPRIGLWIGQDHAESHRHHSHLAAIEPFRTIDPADAAHRAVVERSLRHWTLRGAGAWSGWCVPWAAALCARCGSADGALAWLHWWATAFTNGGDGTLHDAHEPGSSVLGPGWLFGARRERPREIMQMDAAMGALSAVIDILVQDRRDGIAVLPGIPERWSELDADGIACEGGFLVGVTVRRRAIAEVRVESRRGGDLVIRIGHGPRQVIPTTPGQRLVLR